MDAEIPPSPEASPNPAPNTGSAPDSLISIFKDLATELQAALHGRLHLFSLEVHRAGLAITQIVVLALVALLMLSSIWATLMVGVYMLCQAAGWHWAVSLLVVLVANFAGVAGIWLKTRSLMVHLTFPATLRMVKGRALPRADQQANRGELKDA